MIGYITLDMGFEKLEAITYTGIDHRHFAQPV